MSNNQIAPKKALVIGELRGLEVWKNIEMSNYDKVIFLGNLTCDASNVGPSQQWSSFAKLVALKKQYPKTVRLVVGPDDLFYMFPRLFSKVIRNSFDPFQDQYINVFTREEKAFDMCYQVGNWMCSWGGITKYWLATIVQELVLRGYPDHEHNLGDWINRFMYTDIMDTIFAESPETDGFSCPAVTTPIEIEKFAAKGINQVIGSIKATDITRLSFNPDKTELLTVNFFDETKPLTDKIHLCTVTNKTN